MFFILMLLIIIIILLNTLSLLLKKSSIKNREKNSNFECGFDPEHKMRATFSLRFFLITVIFLIFDLEIIMMLPTPLNTPLLLKMNVLHINFLYFLLLSSGLFFEWTQKALTWN